MQSILVQLFSDHVSLFEVNTVRESLQMLDELQDLDFLLVEDWLFLKRPKA